MKTTTLTPEQLRQAANLKERVDALQEQTTALLGTAVAGAPVPAEAPQAPRGPMACGRTCPWAAGSDIQKCPSRCLSQ